MSEMLIESTICILQVTLSLYYFALISSRMAVIERAVIQHTP